MKIWIAVTLLLILGSCSGRKIDSLQQPNTLDDTVYKVIDTSRIYRLVGSYYKYDDKQTNAVTQYNIKKYLKFYENGRLAVFDDFDLNTLDTLTSRVTDQGYYEYAYKTLYTRNFITNKSGKQFYNPQWHTMSGDTLALYSESTKNVSQYIAIDIPSTVFVEKANW